MRPTLFNCLSIRFARAHAENRAEKTKKRYPPTPPGCSESKQVILNIKRL
jgi:hypothetical protein